LSQRRFTRIPRLCQVLGLVLVVFSDSRSSSNPFSSSSFYQSASFCSLGEYVSRPLLRENFSFPSSIASMPCQSLRISLLFLDLVINSFLSRTILVSNLVPIRLLPLFLLSRLHFVFISISSMSLQYRRYTLIRSLCLSRLHLVLASIPTSMSSLQYRRYTLQFRSSPLSSPPFSLHFRRQSSTFITSPSSMYPRIRFYLLLILLGSLSAPPLVLFTFLNVVSYVPCVAYADVCATVLDTSFISRFVFPPSSLHLLSVYPLFRSADVLTFTFR
jgi:hypothetical protein